MTDSTLVIVDLGALLPTVDFSTASIQATLPHPKLHQTVKKAVENHNYDLFLVSNLIYKEQTSTIRSWVQKHFEITKYPKHTQIKLKDNLVPEDASLGMIHMVESCVDTNAKKRNLYCKDVVVADFFAQRWSSQTGLVWSVFVLNSNDDLVLWKASFATSG